MKAPFPYSLLTSGTKTEPDFSFKKAAGITILVGAGIVTLYYFGKSYLKNQAATAADKKSFQSGTPETNARLIRMALDNDGKLGTDVVKLRQIFRNMKSQKEFDDTSTAYANNYGGRKLFGDLEKELQTSEYQEMLAIKLGKPLIVGQKAPYLSQYQGWARRLKASFDKKFYVFSGHDDGALLAAFYDIPTQKDFINTGAIYFKEFGTNLINDLKAELGSGDYVEYMRIIGAKPKE